MCSGARLFTPLLAHQLYLVPLQTKRSHFVDPLVLPWYYPRTTLTTLARLARLALPQYQPSIPFTEVSCKAVR